ncbi:hypothetical protein [Bradyrhizobium sp. 21]|uniref:DUF6894 family protein n=1 Tax=Bradyrhizobium sp. 21 TaxID=2782666 RepID=UPI001FFA6D46|nr:hypothetical protein [Bradyrhizobium sp. 21]MCK1383763.1 hypothetical protein [Bradyrhizobium sp. 21]
MPRFFFNFSIDGCLEFDELGTEFNSIEEAYLEACRTALDMSFEKLRERADPTGDSVEIFDAQRRTLMHLPFSDMLSPKPLRRPPTLESNRIADRCHRELVRGQRLKAEIREELEKVQSISRTIRANLRRFSKVAGTDHLLARSRPD